MLSHIYHLHALTALHAGAGQGTGVIDQPIARERASHLPYVPGSGLKGVLREYKRGEVERAGNKNRAEWLAAFGPEHDNEDNARFQGALVVGDALLLCLPVRSLAGGFAWATCPTQLLRYRRDAAPLKLDNLPQGVPPVAADSVLLGDKDTVLAFGAPKQVVLEEFMLTPGTEQAALAQQWAGCLAAQVFRGDGPWQQQFAKRFAIINDADFDYLAETATEVRARIRIKRETGTAADKALWYEENLPAETVLWGVLSAHESRDGKRLDAAQVLRQAPGPDARLQLGGKASVGRGLARFVWNNPEDKPAGNAGGAS